MTCRYRKWFNSIRKLINQFIYLYVLQSTDYLNMKRWTRTLHLVYEYVILCEDFRNINRIYVVCAPL
jgi:hypothetical protein